MGIVDGIGLGKSAPSKAKAAFIEQAHKAISRMVDEVSDDVLTAALAAGSDIGTLARLISDPSLRDPALKIDPLAPARARAVQHRLELAARAGTMLSAGDTSELLGITRQALDKRRKAASVLGVRVGAEWRYPELQFKNGQPLPRLKEVLMAHHGTDGWVVLDSIMAEDSAYGGRTILGLLQEGDDESLDRVIRQLEGQFAA